MKILVAGSDKVFAIELLYVKYLRELGADVYHFAGQSMFYDFYQKNILNKIFYKAGLSRIHQTINTKFREAVVEFQPDIVWVFKGMEITPASIMWAKSHGCKVVNYNPDNPLLFSGRGSGNKNVTDSIKEFDLYLSYDEGILSLLHKQCNINTDLLPFGFEVSDTLFNEVKQQEEIIKPCFVGNPDKDRAAFIKSIADGGIEIDVYGHHWDKFVKHSNITIFPAVYKKKYWESLYRYRVQLNLMRPHNPDSHNMRTFELGGIGAIQLAPHTKDHYTYFEPGREIFLYEDVPGCIQKIREILSMDNSTVDSIRKNARARSIASKYSYKDRAQQALSIFEQHFNQKNQKSISNEINYK